MAEDLVSRLRDHCDTSHIPGLPCDWLGTKCFNCESADEIERLDKALFSYMVDAVSFLEERDNWRNKVELLQKQVKELETEKNRLERLTYG